MKAKVSSALLVLATSFPASLLCAWVRGHVLLAYLAWFVRPSWPAFPDLPVWGAAGLLFLPQVFRWKASHNETESDDLWAALLSETVSSLLLSGFLLLLGALIAWVGRLP